MDLNQTSRWPLPLGAVMIVLGALGGCLQLTSIAFTAGSQWMIDIAEQANVPMYGMAGIAEYRIPMIISLVIGAELSFLLLVAGVALVRRRQSAARLAIVYSGSRLLHAVGLTVLNVMINATNADEMREDARMENFAAALDMAGVLAIIQFVWYAALPVFLIIWMRRRTIREEMRTWV